MTRKSRVATTRSDNGSGRGLDCLRGSGQGEHGPVMVAIGVEVEQARSGGSGQGGEHASGRAPH